jgi:hypothetical protein
MSELGESNTTSNLPAPQDVTATSQPQQQQGQLPQQPLTQTPQQPAPSVNAAGENLQCQWQGCGERSPSAEALYVSPLIPNYASYS